MPEKVLIAMPLIALIGILIAFVVIYLFWLEP